MTMSAQTAVSLSFEQRIFRKKQRNAGGRFDEIWLARAGLNRRPLPCQGSALPLSYAPAGGGN